MTFQEDIFDQNCTNKHQSVTVPTLIITHNCKITIIIIFAMHESGGEEIFFGFSTEREFKKKK